MNGQFNNVNPEQLFDDDFQPLSTHMSEEMLKSIEVALRSNGQYFLLSIMTADLYMERSQDADGPDKTYVLPTYEILPADLMEVRHKPIGKLHEYLVAQTD